jgi:phosphatidylserine decarboxylase
VPLGWRKWIYTTFANQYGANLEEVKEDITTFKSFREFFT